MERPDGKAVQQELALPVNQFVLSMSWPLILVFIAVDHFGVNQLGQYCTADQLTQSVILAVDQSGIDPSPLHQVLHKGTQKAPLYRVLSYIVVTNWR